MLPLNGAGGQALEVAYGLGGVKSKKVDLDGSMVGVQSCYRCR